MLLIDREAVCHEKKSRGGRSERNDRSSRDFWILVG